MVEGKWVLAKEHPHFLMKPEVPLHFLRHNPGMAQSITTDDIRLLLSLISNLTPPFLFLHPALRVPSNWRTQIPVTDSDVDDEDDHVWSTLQWIRMVFIILWKHMESNGKLRGIKVRS